MSHIIFELYSPEQSGIAGIRPKPEISIPLDSAYAFPTLLPSRSMDVRAEAAKGDILHTARRQKFDLEFTLTHLPIDIAQRIMDLHQNRRAIQVNPNCGVSTIASYPLTRTLAPTKGPAFVHTPRAQNRYQWDPEAKIIHRWPTDEPMIAYGGPYNRHLRTVLGTLNHMQAAGIPSSSGTQWSITLGTGTSQYTEDQYSPLLANIPEANVGGVWETIFTGLPGRIESPITTAFTLGQDVAIVVYARVGLGGWQFYLQSQGALSGISVAGETDWQQIVFSYANHPGGADVLVAEPLYGAAISDQTLVTGPIWAGHPSIGFSSSPHTIPYPDYGDGAAGPDDFIADVGTLAGLGDFTISWQWRYSTTDNAMWQLGDDSWPTLRCFTETAGGPLVTMVLQDGPANNLKWDNIEQEMAYHGVAEGEWCEFALRFRDVSGELNARLFVNGREYQGGGGARTGLIYGPYDGSIYIGRLQDGTRALELGGIAMWRLEGKNWTDEEISNHYTTYLDTRGLGISRRVLGRKYLMDEPQLSPGNYDGEEIYNGTVVLREFELDEDIAPYQPMELT